MLSALTRVLEPLASSHAPHLVIALWISAMAVLVLRDHRLALLAFMAQRVVVAVLLLPTVGVPLVTTHAISSIATVVMCLVGEWLLRRLTTTVTGGATASDQRAFWGPALRLTSGSLGLLLAYALLPRIGVAWLPPAVAQAAACLIISSVFMLLLAESPLRTGLAVLTFADGARLIYALWQPNPVAWGLWNVCDVCVALAASMLRRHEVVRQRGTMVGEQA